MYLCNLLLCQPRHLIYLCKFLPSSSNPSVSLNPSSAPSSKTSVSSAPSSNPSVSVAPSVLLAPSQCKDPGAYCGTAGPGICCQPTPQSPTVGQTCRWNPTAPPNLPTVPGTSCQCRADCSTAPTAPCLSYTLGTVPGPYKCDSPTDCCSGNCVLGQPGTGPASVGVNKPHLLINASRRTIVTLTNRLPVSQSTLSSIARAFQVFLKTLWIPKAPTLVVWHRTCWILLLMLL